MKKKEFGMTKQNFSKWVFTANAFKYRAICIDSYSVFRKDRGLRNFCSELVWDGFASTKQTDWWQKGSVEMVLTQKFVDEFFTKFKQISQKIRPDFSEEMRDRMLYSFSFLKERI